MNTDLTLHPPRLVANNTQVSYKTETPMIAKHSQTTVNGYIRQQLDLDTTAPKYTEAPMANFI